ncbi:hypothetical protein HAX54_021467 [Datura stramonium]|uniref:Glycine-rich protein n=1 Tax=Datura stramonium TaxID=4076 RepID=A0ABS8UUC4_DATST|nr:hypothetical protein [Datura stramonium]
MKKNNSKALIYITLLTFLFITITYATHTDDINGGGFGFGPGGGFNIPGFGPGGGGGGYGGGFGGPKGGYGKGGIIRPTIEEHNWQKESLMECQLVLHMKTSLSSIRVTAPPILFHGRHNQVEVGCIVCPQLQASSGQPAGSLNLECHETVQVLSTIGVKRENCEANSKIRGMGWLTYGVPVVMSIATPRQLG